MIRLKTSYHKVSYNAWGGYCSSIGIGYQRTHHQHCRPPFHVCRQIVVSRQTVVVGRTGSSCNPNQPTIKIPRHVRLGWVDMVARGGGGGGAERGGQTQTQIDWREEFHGKEETWEEICQTLLAF